MTEATLTRRALERLNALPQCKAIKYHGSRYGEAGTPDIIGSICGLMFLIEVKTPRGKVTTIQHRRIKQWRETRAQVFVVRDNETLNAAIGQLREVVGV